MPNLEEVYNKVKKMNPYSYPDDLDPFASKHHIASNPNMFYKLVVGDKTIEVSEFPIGGSEEELNLSSKGKQFFEVVNLVIDTLQASEEWKALPDYEFYYNWIVIYEKTVPN